MSLTKRAERRLDHLVLPVVDLMTARLRLAALGFSVAPDARHPFGTENACVYFADGTYLEPLGIADLELYKHQTGEFVRRDRAFRFRQGDNGLSALAFKSDDAAADHAAFTDTGIAAGELFSFSRAFRGADGSEATASFRLAFAADLRAPDLFFFTCEREQPLSPPEALLGHGNGVTGIAEVVLGETNPMDFEPLVTGLAGGGDVDIHPHGVTVSGPGASLSVFSHDYLHERLGIVPPPPGRGLFARAIVFEASDLAALAEMLEQNGVAHRRADDSLRVPPAPGQGATFIFKEA
ncbi:VOC family protein [Martelella endophytica]|uniref:Glyoxalase-like domain-containing protein n=1 Tax=Martelella endophytica TaxID=1486262 RepID=A0A0D5LWU6_MAREN|nr:VOC family protein [Martelella endophytica]AJY48287.1 hypothetical protein TM49_16645 [Martelella endophytica]